MQLYRLGRLLVVVVVGTFVFMAASGEAPALATLPCDTTTNPCFSDVADVLGGQWLLLRDDDLVMTSASGHLLTSTLLPTSNSTISSSGVLPALVADNFTSSSLLLVAATGRLFNLPADSTVTVAPTTSPTQILLCVEYQFSAQGGTSISAPVQPLSVPSGFTYNSVDAMATADFDQDGYDELVVLLPGHFMQILKAVDPNDPTQGLQQVGSWVAAGAASDTFYAMAVGDFDGDGRPEVARLTNNAGQLALSFDTIDPSTLAITAGQPTNIGSTVVSGWSSLTVTLTAGQFDGNPADDELVVAYAHDSFTKLRVSVFDVDTQLSPSQLATVDMDVENADVQEIFNVRARSGPLNASAPNDAVVIGVSENALLSSLTASFIFVLTLDQNNLSVASTLTLAGGSAKLGCLLDLAVGRFDPPPVQTSPLIVDFDLQVAVLGTQENCVNVNFKGSNTPQLAIYNTVDGDKFSFALQSTFEIAGSLGVDWQNVMGLPILIAGDLQGRSLRLGPPTKVVINSHAQPDIVLGIPPMHIDWITPENPSDFGCTSTGPCVVNISVQPTANSPNVSFSTAYAFSSSTSTEASRQNTTSYSFAFAVSGEQKISYGIPDETGVSAEFKEAAKNTHDTTVSKTYNTYTGTAKTLTATTGFADFVLFSTYRLNVFNYPVIGQCTAVAGAPATPGCAAGTAPLVVQFSGPDMVTPSELDATTLEWYQPVQEPGNVFSYPCDLPELLSNSTLPGLTTLTDTPASWQGTDTSTLAYSTTWSAQLGASQTSGTTNTHSGDFSQTVSASASIGDFGLSATDTFEENTSQSVNTLNTSTQTLSASTGIQVTKPAFSSTIADNYIYYFGGYVLGVTNPNTVQTIALQDAQGNPIDIASTGPLLTGFVANPQGPGGTQVPWWAQAYSQPDVAVNHPARWDWSTSTFSASFNPPCSSPSTCFPQDEPFYQMKGLFITADTSDGPQVSQATDGDQLLLQARVYNYSLAAMATDTTVQVSIYRQQYDSGKLVGPSSLIGQTSLPPIPPFPGSSCVASGSPDPPSPPNWALATVDFDTTGLGGANGTYWVFWVVVWMVDPAGNLVPEVPDHGLTALPPVDMTSITQVPIEAYSNNVGLYGAYSSFYIAPANGALAKPPSQPGDLAIESLSVPAAPLLLDHKARVTARLRAGDANVGAHLVAFYDGDPQQGGQVFELQRIAHIAANDTYVSRAFFRPRTCGEHTVVVVAAPETAVPATQRTSVSVTIVPQDLVRALEETIKRQALPQGIERSLLVELQAAEKAFATGRADAAVNQLNAFTKEVQAKLGKQLTRQQADLLIGQVSLILGCV